MRLALECCDADADIVNFIKEKSTGSKKPGVFYVVVVFTWEICFILKVVTFPLNIMYSCLGSGC